MTGEFSRRSFLKYTALTAVAVAGSSLLTYTTSPTTLTDALERLMKPQGAEGRIHAGAGRMHCNFHHL